MGGNKGKSNDWLLENAALRDHVAQVYPLQALHFIPSMDNSFNVSTISLYLYTKHFFFFIWNVERLEPLSGFTVI